MFKKDMPIDEEQFWDQFMELFKTIPLSNQLAIIEEYEKAEAEHRGMDRDLVWTYLMVDEGGMN